MTYRHYETEGLIISHRNLGEANRLYKVLTSDFGLVDVLAQGVRLDKSKLRSHLQNFSFVNLVLVRGREFWRVVGVADLGFPRNLSKEALSFLKKVSLVLLRLIQGEDHRSELYQDLKKIFSLILAQKELLPNDAVDVEIFILVRILSKLGYLPELAGRRAIFLCADFSWPEIRETRVLRRELIQQINQALELTQL